MKDLETCRKEIDEIDHEMITLFERRMNVAKDVVTYKLTHEMTIFQKEREEQVILKNLERMQNEDLKPYARNFITNMMNISKSYQSTFLPKESLHFKHPEQAHVRVGYQGVPGSFSSQAMRKYFGEVTPTNYPHFEDVFEGLKNNEIDYGVVPLENSSTGAINDNYDLITQYGFFIVGEQSISIAQHLLGIKGSHLEDIKTVYSHPQGLLQTSRFLDAHHIEKSAYQNTAAAAKYVNERQDPSIGAIASLEAAELYHLDVLAQSIQNDHSNHTRFIIISRELESSKEAERISLVFTVKHEVGALYEVMRVIKDHSINMARIESRPLPSTPWEYYFYVDIDGNLEDQNIIRALDELKCYTNTFRLLGNYERKES